MILPGTWLEHSGLANRSKLLQEWPKRWQPFRIKLSRWGKHSALAARTTMLVSPCPNCNPLHNFKRLKAKFSVPFTMHAASTQGEQKFLFHVMPLRRILGIPENFPTSILRSCPAHGVGEASSATEHHGWWPKFLTEFNGQSTLLWVSLKERWNFKKVYREML